jgi:hypothetical protein
MPKNDAPSRRRWLLAGTAAAVVVAADVAPVPGGAAAEELGPLTRITGGSPFRGCTADDVAGQDDPDAGIVNFPNTEIEPWVAANPADPDNLLAGWQQDRWSNGGARGLVAGVSRNGGASWRTVVAPGRVTECQGGRFARASDPWVDFSTAGVAYFMHLAFEPDLPTGAFGRNAMLVSRSTDGGLTWERPVTLIEDADPQVLNDKNSLTADPTNPSLAYAVWDRLQDFTIPPPDGGDEGAKGRTGEGVALARERIARLRAAEESAGGPEQAPAPTEVLFKGPTYFARTTNAGRTWERGREIYDPGPNEQTLGNQIVVQPSGTLVNFFTHILPTGVTRLELIRSTDKGRTWERRPTVATVEVTFRSITPDQQEPIRDAANLFDVAVDPRNGNLYAVLQEYRYRGVEEVSFLQSTDDGRTWSAPVRINKTPADRNPLRQQAIVPSIEVGPGGVLVATYYDFRNDRDRGELADYWAVSCDPSARDCRRSSSWGGELRLTRRSFDFLDAPVARGHFLGDYMGLDRAGDAVVAVFGVATGPNLTDLIARKITFGMGVASVAP